MNKTIVIKRPGSIDIDRSINQILYDLSRYGRAISNNGVAARQMERSFREQKRNGDIYFSWNNYNRKSVIALAPDKRLILISEKKCRLEDDK